ncbi:MAG TPA: hypothetical protein VFE10_07120, partial [Phenylobacterium sp.]|nr:hypothetical protein [Phenylobacterium sp.]
TDAEITARGHAILRRREDDALAATALKDIDAWMRSGAPPAAADLRAQGFSGDGTAETLREARQAFVRQWGFSLPCREAVTALRGFGPILEVGAGTGFWTAVMRAAGHHMIATDLAAGLSPYGFCVSRHAEVEQLSAVDAVRKYPDRDLFCSWPSENEPWAAEAVGELRSGRKLALILDDRGTITGDDNLRRVLAEQCRALEMIEIPRFPGLHDRMRLFERRAD